MKIIFLFINKTKDKWISEGENEFIKRLQKFAQVEFRIIKECNKGDTEKIKKTEGENIISKIKSDELVCLLDVKGKLLSSEELAEEIKECRDLKGGKMVFIVGGAWGVSEEVKKRADLIISMSKMTFTHQMIRVFLMEQVYRGFSILQGSGYHK